VLEGFHPLKHALRFGADILDAASPDVGSVIALASEVAPDVVERVAALLAEVPESLLGDLTPDPPSTPVVALARRPATDLEGLLRASGPVVALERPNHLGNIGAVVRVAAAAEAAGVVTTGDRDPWHPTALRGSAGLHFALPVVRTDTIPATSRPIVAIDPGGEPLDSQHLPPEPMLVFGSERSGVGNDVLSRADIRLAIPMRAGVSSLNLATAVAVVLFAGRLTGSN
jgi:TrmH family RNA methyltransferase